MAAGLTDHVWTTEELLAYRVPVEFLDQLRTIEHLFPAWNGVQQHLENLRRNAQPVYRKYGLLLGLPVSNSASNFAGAAVHHSN